MSGTQIAVPDRAQFAVCVCNDGDPAALELHKIYRMIPDPQAEEYGLVRIVDESGEGYLDPAGYFSAVDLPASAREQLLQAS